MIAAGTGVSFSTGVLHGGGFYSNLGTFHLSFGYIHTGGYGNYFSVSVSYSGSLHFVLGTFPALLRHFIALASLPRSRSTPVPLGLHGGCVWLVACPTA